MSDRGILTAGKSLVDVRARWRELSSYGHKQCQELVNVKLEAYWGTFDREERPDEYMDVDRQRRCDLYVEIMSKARALNEILDRMAEQLCKYRLGVESLVEAQQKSLRIRPTALSGLSLPFLLESESKLLGGYEQDMLVKRVIAKAVLCDPLSNVDLEVPVVRDRQTAVTALAVWRLEPYIDDGYRQDVDECWESLFLSSTK
jgi:hypothetical protein